MIHACLLILAGGFAAQHSRVPVNSDLSTLLIVAAVALFFVRRVRFAGLLLLGFCLFMRAGQGIVDARLDHRLAGDSVLTRVRVVDFPKVSGATVTMTVTPIADSRLPARSRVSWFEATPIPEIGDVWEFELRLRRPRGNSNPGSFDLEAWMFREKIHAAGYVVGGKRNRLLESGAVTARDEFRKRFVRRVQDVVPSAEAAAVLSAIGVGTRHLIAREQWQRYAVTGTSHLMAISGLHVGLAATAAFFVLAGLSGGLRVPGNHLDHALLGGALVASLYAFVSGLAVPSLRATIMLLVVASVVLARRRVSAARVVAIAAIIVFLLDPVSSMSPGFRLSFGAVVVLLWFAQRRFRPADGQRLPARVGNTLRQLVAMQGALLFGLLPLTVIGFNRIAITAPAVNLLVVPIFSFVTVPATLAAMLPGARSAAADAVLLWLAAASIAGIEAIILGFASLPLADVTTAGIHGAAGCFLALAILWVVLPQRWPGRHVAVLALIAVVLQKPAGPDKSCFDVHVLDVGQGLAAVVQTESHAMLFDTGLAYRNGGSAAERIILPFLRHRGIRHVDWLLVSHADNDHAGGFEALAENLSIGRVFVGEPLATAPLPASRCAAGQGWRVDGVDFRVLHPAPGLRRSGNDSSCVIEVAVAGHALLLTGDIEAMAEETLLQRGALRASDVIVIPHHGSLTSSTPAFVDAVQAGIAIAAAGYGNRWGFPRPRVVSRWEDSGALVLSTADAGAVSLRLCASGGIRALRQYRLQQRRFWREPP